MESVLQPPPPFQFDNSLCNITSGNLSTEWQKWKTAFNIYYEACELSNKNKKTQVNILLHIVGEKCREVAAQFNEQWNTVDELLKKFDDFFIPKKNLAVERHKFFKRDQRELESAEQYVFELNKMAVQCEFKDLRDDLVCSRLICGIRDIALSERLLREPDMRLEKAIEICRLAEMSRMQARNIKENQEYNSQVHAINEEKISEHDINGIQRREQSTQGSRTSKQTKTGRSRYDHPPRQDTVNHSTHTPKQTVQRYQHANRCGYCGRVHRRYECPARGQRCMKCNRINHFARMCRVHSVLEDSTDQAQVCSISASNVLTDTHFVEIQKSTLEDEDMQLLTKTIKRGWPVDKSTLDNKLKPFWECKEEQGIPETVMSDNGPEFSSLAFSDFARNWKFRHVTSSPRYPQSNGQVERSIQTIKQIIRKTAYDQSDFNLALLEYLNTPISKELPSPAELLYSRKLRSIVPCNPILLKPTLHNNTAQKIKSRQQIQKYYYDRGSKNLTPLCVGQKVKVRINNTWQSGIVKNRFGMRSYVVLLNNGTSLRRNRRHLIADSNRTCLSPQNEYSLLYDDINLDTSQSTSVGSGELVLQSADDNCSNAYRTRFGRIVRPRWGYSKNRNSIGECK
ncbi:unnamed protein product [Arctia plantaginis]|uniref:Integrase catalytic domain-containing protein n=1 Tax=Arctia plantaginis TaxID=874455 RepID=A0A8S1AW72_ARCPL|nr:unnamed protein product [Arctia plantaginis]